MAHTDAIPTSHPHHDETEPGPRTQLAELGHQHPARRVVPQQHVRTAPAMPETIRVPDDRFRESIESTARRIEHMASLLATQAIARMEATLPWFAVLPPDQRATVGLMSQTGITGFSHWLRDPDHVFKTAGKTFAIAPAGMARAISLQQTVELVRIVVDVVESATDRIAGSEDGQWLRVALVHFSREVAFAAALFYARAAEQRGSWNAHLEALLVDAILRGEMDDGLLSRAAALGWTGREQVVVIGGIAAPGTTVTVLGAVQDIARRNRLPMLAGVQADRLIVIVGDCPDPIAAATTMLPAYAPGPVVAGPTVPDLLHAHYSAAAALAGLRAAPAWLGAPRPVVADDLLPERALDGDPLARQVLLHDVYAPLLKAGEAVVGTVAMYLESAHSVEVTAKGLFVHPNTVRYRLHRAHAACGRLASDPRDSRVLQTAITLGHLRAGSRPNMPAAR